MPSSNLLFDPGVLVERTRSLRGCLFHLQTPNISSRRRRPDNEDKEDPFIMHDPFLGDLAKLLCSKPVRLLGMKTQVVTAPLSPLIRTRRTHTDEVVACAVVISNILGLNTSLAIAIATGHDIGHVPLGHQGEAFLAEAMGRPEFCHEVMAPIIAQKIERRGQGLNLTHQTLEGMMRHSGNLTKEGMSQEAWVVNYADKLAYIFADFNDIAGRMGFPVSAELRQAMNEFGESQRKRTTAAMAGLVIESAVLGKVSFKQSELAIKFKRLRELMYEVYPRVIEQNAKKIMEPVLDFLTRLGIGDPFLFMSLMTDNDVVNLASEPVKSMEHLRRTAVAEMLPYLEEIGKVDLCDPCLDW